MPDLLPFIEKAAKGVYRFATAAADNVAWLVQGACRETYTDATEASDPDCMSSACRDECVVDAAAERLADAEAERDVVTEPPVVFVERGGFDAKLCDCGCGEMVTTATYSTDLCACEACRRGALFARPVGLVAPKPTNPTGHPDSPGCDDAWSRGWNRGWNSCLEAYGIKPGTPVKDPRK